MKTFDDFKIDRFEFNGRGARVIIPDKADDRRSWAFKMEYGDAFPETEIELLERGYHVAFIQNKTRFASDDDIQMKVDFAKFITRKYGLNAKCVPIGMSLGGAQAIIFAGKYPEMVEGMFIDAPVLNFCMFADEKYSDVWENEVEKAYPNVKRYQFLALDNHPMNKLDKLTENKIPVLMLWGTEDQTVNFSENGRFLAEAYEAYPELLTVMERKWQGHHPHGLGASSHIIADYIVEHFQG